MQKQIVAAILMMCPALVAAEPFELLTGVDATKYPGAARSLTGDPGPGYPDANDGDRLAGTADVGAVVPNYTSGTPLFAPNEFGALSFIYRRGTLPFGGFFPLLGIEFIGGPLLDMDGDPNLPRTLIPSVSATTTAIPDTSSFVDLAFDLEAGTVTLENVDATTTNEGGSGQSSLVMTTVLTLAGAADDGQPGDPINPAFDTRVGTVTAIGGLSGTLSGVYAIDGLGFEIWQDSIDPASSSVADLGTIQQFGTLSGWMIQRDPNTGNFPTLSGEGLSTIWPAVATPPVSAITTATGVAPSVMIGTASGTDDYTAAGNGGLALTDFGGDLGAYLDTVVIPLLPASKSRLIYLEAAGFGVNNSFDPIFGDTIGYDIVLIGAADTPCGYASPGDSNCSGSVDAFDIDPFVTALLRPEDWKATQPCNYLCANDLNQDGLVDAFDIDPFINLLLGQ